MRIIKLIPHISPPDYALFMSIETLHVGRISGSIAPMLNSMNKHLTVPRLAALGILIIISWPVITRGDSFSVLGKNVITLSGETVDAAVSNDGKWTFVLTNRGEVAVYGITGELIQTLEVGKGFDTIAYNPAGNKLILGGSGKQQLSVLTLAMLYELDYTGSPFKGPADAPVAIAVFNDFQ